MSSGKPAGRSLYREISEDETEMNGLPVPGSLAARKVEFEKGNFAKWCNYCSTGIKHQRNVTPSV